MKKIYLSVISIILASILFAGCDLFLAGKVNENTEDEDGIKLVLVDPLEKISSSKTVASRTVRPEVIWSNYHYTFEIYAGYVSEENPGTYIQGFEGEKVAFAKIDNKQYPMAPVNYKFILTGYSTTSDQPVIRGVSIADLSTGAKTVEFKMYPVAGLKGSAEVIIKIPNDGSVATVKAGWSTNPVASASEVEAAGKLTTLAITSGSTVNTAKYVLDNLDSAVEQYAIFYLYDANGALISTRAESLYVVGETKSVDNSIEFTQNDYHSYQVSIQLKLNGENWATSGKTLKLVDKTDSSIEYALVNDSTNQHVFNGNAAEGVYYIYDGTENTGVEFDSVNGSTVLNYYTVNLSPCKGSGIVTVSGGIAHGADKVLVVQGQTYVYKVQLVDGYEKASGFSIKVNSVSASTAVNTNLNTVVNAETTISVENVQAIEYTISYDISGGGTWQSGYPAAAAKTYTVETSVELPTLEHLRQNGKILDGWKLSTDVSATPKVFAKTPSDITGNITVVPVWKDSVQIDTVNKKIYACGISLICQWKDSSKSETNLYVDWNRNGVKDLDDQLVVAANGTTNFTGYEFYAYNTDGSLPASDFYFTMMGGNIASFTGLGATSTNETYVNLSGNSIIGDGATKGVDLTSITNEWVNVVGAMEGNYSITLFTQYRYNRNDTMRIVAYIGNTTWADFTKFKCLHKTDLDVQKISYKDIDENGVNKTIVYLVDPDPIAFPGNSGVIWKEEESGNKSDTNFWLGDSANISEECSVFSISVTNGTFKVGSLKMKNAEGEELNTTDLGQKSGGGYDEGLDLDHEYTYIHMMSTQNEISPYSATQFLKGIEFIKNDPNVDISIKINLETVAYQDIANMGSKFSYYDGSFYLGVDSSLTWSQAYNEARNTKFNNLSGYLINITSDVENDYIYKRMGLGQCWTGGARFEPGDGFLTNWDQDSVGTPGNTSTVSKFYWVAGPEAGSCYTEGNWPDAPASTDNKVTLTSSSKSEVKSTSSSLQNLQNKRIYILDEHNSIIGEGTAGTCSSSGSWLGKTYTLTTGINYTGTPKYVVSAEGNGKKLNYGNGAYFSTALIGFTNWDTGEPNDSYKGNSEQCMHFLNTGKWNDYAYNNGEVPGYIVEFTPYLTPYGEQCSGRQSIKKTATY